MRRNAGAAWPSTRALSPNVLVRMRSWRMRPTSISAIAISGPVLKRGVSHSDSPISKMPACPSQARSVVDSPTPAAE